MTNRYMGSFKQLKDLHLPTDEDLDLYEGFFAKFYEDLTKTTVYDLPFYLEQAQSGQGPILELACGAGRVSVELAKHGFHVVGVDNSESMIGILDQKIKKSDLATNIQYYLDDMVTFQLNQTFDLAILPATSICLIPDDETLLEFFQNLYDHLNKGGKFIFDYTISELKGKRPIEEKPMQIHTLEHGTYKQFVLFAEQFDYHNRHIHVNFYGELVDSTGRTSRKFGYTRKRLLTDSIISNVVKQTPFKVSHTHLVKENNVSIRFMVLEK